jgi:hypothetical protein
MTLWAAAGSGHSMQSMAKHADTKMI